MRPVHLTILAVVGVALVACQSTRKGLDSTAANVGRGAAEVREGLGDAVTAPLEDLNLKRDAIPAVLLAAQDNPYELEGLQRCEGIAAEVARLDMALGPDLDEPPPPKRTRGQAAADETADAALAAIRNVTTDVIPMRGWVRRLSGAQRHSRKVQSAIKAGLMRRSYLKGVGMQRNCHPPAAPRWFRPRTEAGLGVQPSAPLRGR